MKLGIAEILKKASEAKKKTDRINILRQHDSVPLRSILKAAFDPNIKFLLPEGTPPYKKSDSFEGQGMLYSEARKLYLFIEGGHNNLTPLKRQTLFINMLESIDKDDAELLVAVKDKTIPYKGITEKLVKEAFPGLF